MAWSFIYFRYFSIVIKAFKIKNKAEAEARANALVTRVVIALVAAVLAFPVYVFIYKYMPVIRLPFSNIRIDHFITFIPVYAVVLYLALRIRVLLIYLILGGMTLLLLSGMIGIYGFGDLYQDYKTTVYNLREGAKVFYFEKEGVEVFPNASRFQEAINYQNKSVRDYSVNIAVKWFKEYNSSGNRKVIHYFSIFKEIRANWLYVFDPEDSEFYSLASETIKLLNSDGKFKGDCDDYSILMAACIKAVGGKVRLVRTRIQRGGETVGHVYPEVMVGNVKDLENINYLIRTVLFEKENSGKPIFYCEDPDGSVWLNFDYNDFYPGGMFASKIRIATLEI